MEEIFQSGPIHSSYQLDQTLSKTFWLYTNRKCCPVAGSRAANRGLRMWNYLKRAVETGTSIYDIYIKGQQNKQTEKPLTLLVKMNKSTGFCLFTKQIRLMAIWILSTAIKDFTVQWVHYTKRKLKAKDHCYFGDCASVILISECWAEFWDEFSCMDGSTV